jgi:2-polyprenyl-3-methyl-5-hydroxy-6-metoxy-1,4-benzoquinol methylase
MTEPVSAEILRRYYHIGWERRWLARLNEEGVPGDAGYKLRLRRTLDLVRPPFNRPFRVLDAGCGVGIYSIHLARRFPLAHVLGIDLSPLQVSAATDLAVKLDVSSRVTFKAMDLTSPNLAADCEGDWDVILIAEVLEHMPQPGPVLKALRSLAAPGAQVIISVPQWTPDDPGEPWIYHRVLTGGANMDNVESRDPATLPIGEMYTYYHRHYRPMEMQTLLTDAGLEVQRHKTVFWQRPARLQGAHWRACDYLLRRTAWGWLDRMLQALGGTEWAHNLLWDCRVPGKP